MNNQNKMERLVVCVIGIRSEIQRWIEWFDIECLGSKCVQETLERHSDRFGQPGEVFAFDLVIIWFQIMRDEYDRSSLAWCRPRVDAKCITVDSRRKNYIAARMSIIAWNGVCVLDENVRD